MNLPPSSPPLAPDGIDQRRLADDVWGSYPVSLVTAVWFSAAAKLVDPVTSGDAVGPRTLTLAGADSRCPSSVHGAVFASQATPATPAGRVMVTSPLPLGLTSIFQAVLSCVTSRPWFFSVPPVIVNSPFVNALAFRRTFSLKRRCTLKFNKEPSWWAGTFSNRAVNGGATVTVTITESSWDRPCGSVTRSVNVKVVVSVNAAGTVKVAVAALASVSVPTSLPVCVQA